MNLGVNRFIDHEASVIKSLLPKLLFCTPSFRWRPFREDTVGMSVTEDKIIPFPFFSDYSSDVEYQMALKTIVINAHNVGFYINKV